MSKIANAARIENSDSLRGSWREFAIGDDDSVEHVCLT